jgi:hypothetical protein
LKPYDQEKLLILATDSSFCALGVVLSQPGNDNPTTLHPIEFASRKLSSEECNYDMVEKEALPLWHSYGLSKDFIAIRMDDNLISTQTTELWSTYFLPGRTSL